jgi:hypothetical protein
MGALFNICVLSNFVVSEFSNIVAIILCSSFVVIRIVLAIVYSQCQDKVQGQGNGNFRATGLTILRRKRVSSGQSTESCQNTSASTHKNWQSEYST